MNESKDDPRDAHLLAALRHAPDRDATPPREVSERILAAARAAVRSSDETHAPWWQRLSAWLTQPQVAASFGTLVVASLVGLMWGTREPTPSEFTPPAAAERMAPRPAPAPVDALRSDAAKTEADVAAAPSAAPPMAGIGARPQGAAPASRPKQAPAKSAASRNESGPVARQRADALTTAETTAVSPPTAPPAAVTAATPQQAADAAVPAAAAERRAAGASDSRLLELRRDAAAPRPASGAAVGMALAAKANADGDPLASLDALLGAVDRASRLSWVRGSGSTPHGEAQRAWWRGVRESTQGHWARVEPAVQPLAPWLVLRVDGGAGFILWSVNDHLLIADASGRTWRAPITPAQREAWTAEVARW